MKSTAELKAVLAKLKQRLRKVPGYRSAHFISRLFRGVESRNTALLMIRPPQGLYQPYGETSIDRYPEIFRFVQEQIGDEDDIRILSFGCSTGEEMFSLRRYFPKAEIVGLDINPFNIAICRFRRWKSRDRKIRFSVASSTASEASETYDAIFAMAVFRHGDLNSSPPPANCDHRIRFVDFEKTVTDMARVIKPGGLLIIQHAMFRFSDTRVSDSFEATLTIMPTEKVPIYSSNDSLLGGIDYSEVVFQKTPIR